MDVAVKSAIRDKLQEIIQEHDASQVHAFQATFDTVFHAAESGAKPDDDIFYDFGESVVPVLSFASLTLGTYFLVKDFVLQFSDQKKEDLDVSSIRDQWKAELVKTGIAVETADQISRSFTVDIVNAVLDAKSR